MFNSFLCGDKSAIEMCAVSNAADLKCPSNGLTFPPIGVYDIAKKLIPKQKGGLIDFDGQVEVISSIDLNKNDIPNDLRWGVYIVIKAKNEYVKNCFKDYGMVTDSSGNYSAIWRPYHYIGLELAQSIYSIALDNRATGFTKKYNADVKDKHYKIDLLAVTLDQVKANFKCYGLLDEQVKFLKGWFKETLPTAPIEKLAILRLDGDMYESTMDALVSLYPKVSPGGYVIVDDGNGNIIRTKSQIQPNSEIVMSFSDGKINAIISDRKEKIKKLITKKRTHNSEQTDLF